MWNPFKRPVLAEEMRQANAELREANKRLLEIKQAITEADRRNGK